MKKYLRSNVVMAEPMNLGAYNAYRGWKLPENETGKEEGYHLVYADGYESWCPKTAFEKVSREINCMTFGQAIEALKMGKRCARKGWNGKEQYIELATHVSYMDPDNKIHNVNHSQMGNKAIAFVGTSGIQLGWLASQSDMLSEDWQLVG